jgi:hypothetical protein
MSLETRRKIKELQDNVLPERHAELLEITGATIQYDIDWESFGDDTQGLNFLDNLSCHRTNMALRVICSDDLGKEAVQEGLKSIKLSNAASKADMHLNFDGGVLDMKLAYAMGTEGYYSDGEIRQALMAKL